MRHVEREWSTSGMERANGRRRKPSDESGRRKRCQRTERRCQVKYDVLEPLRRYMEAELQMNPNTAKKYYGAVVNLFERIQFNNIQEIPKGYLEEQMRKITGKNNYSAAKNGLQHLKKLYPDLALPEEEVLKTIGATKKNRSKKPRKTIYLQEVTHKVNQIQNERLKYAYRLAMVSGLRVSELGELEESDLLFDNGNIFVTVKKGKGGHGGTIKCRQDEYLYHRLHNYCLVHPEGKLFYSEVYMREQADRLGMECHDFRRIFAILSRNDYRKEMDISEANEQVQKDLRHVRFSTTKRYLFNRKLSIKRKREKEHGNEQF